QIASSVPNAPRKASRVRWISGGGGAWSKQVHSTTDHTPSRIAKPAIPAARMSRKLNGLPPIVLRPFFPRGSSKARTLGPPHRSTRPRELYPQYNLARAGFRWIACPKAWQLRTILLTREEFDDPVRPDAGRP